MTNEIFFNNFVALMSRNLNNKKKKKNEKMINSIKIIKINSISKRYFNVNEIKKKLKKIFFSSRTHFRLRKLFNFKK